MFLIITLASACIYLYTFATYEDKYLSSPILFPTLFFTLYSLVYSVYEQQYYNLLALLELLSVPSMLTCIVMWVKFYIDGEITDARMHWIGVFWTVCVACMLFKHTIHPLNIYWIALWYPFILPFYVAIPQTIYGSSTYAKYTDQFSGVVITYCIIYANYIKFRGPKVKVLRIKKSK